MIRETATMGHVIRDDSSGLFPTSRHSHILSVDLDEQYPCVKQGGDEGNNHASYQPIEAPANSENK
jgi:hypothetical protein